MRINNHSKAKLIKNEAMAQVIACLNEGGLVAFPTDTVYGLACKLDLLVMDKVYQAKGRDFNKPLPIMADSLKMLEKIADVDEKSKKLIKTLTPGALTIVVNRKEDLDQAFSQGKDTIAVRIPDDPWVLELIRELDTPIMVTSANKSGQPSLFLDSEVYEQLGNDIDLLVQGKASGKQASTIVDVRQEVKILRSGPISMQDILEALL